MRPRTKKKIIYICVFNYFAVGTIHINAMLSCDVDTLYRIGTLTKTLLQRRNYKFFMKGGVIRIIFGKQ